jgi:hypothetical protein
MKFADVLLTLSYVGTAFSAAVPWSNSGLDKRDWNRDGSGDTCGGTTWESGVAGMSAAVAQDCLDMISDDNFGVYYRGYFSVTATDLKQFQSAAVVWHKTCMFTAAVANGATLHIGVDDISDLVRDSVVRSDNGNVLANGAMTCSGDSGDGQMTWSLAKYNGN